MNIKKRSSFILFILIINVSALSALEFENNPTLPYIDKPWCLDIAFTNDGFLGSGLTKDWDDNRTFGFFARGELPYDINYDFHIDSFTNRGDAGRNLEPGRFDRIELGIGYPVYIHSGENTRFITSAGGNLHLDTNLGLGAVQAVYHEAIGQDRDIPKEYYPASGGLELYLEQRYLTGRRFTGDFSATVAFNTFLEPYLDLSAYLWDTATKSHLYLGIGYNVAYPNLRSREIFNSIAREQGINAQYGIVMNHFFFFRTINLFDSGFRLSEDQKSLGGVGFRFGGGDNNSPYSRRGNLICDQGFPVANRIQSQIIWQPDFYYDLFPVLTERTGFYLSSSNGWDKKNPDGDITDQRFEAYSAGIRIYLFRPQNGWSPNLFVDIGPGFRWTLLYRNADADFAAPEKMGFSGFIEFREGLYIPFYGFGKPEKTEYGVSFFVQQQIGLSEDPKFLTPEGDPAHVGFSAGIAFTFSDKNLYADQRW